MSWLLGILGAAVIVWLLSPSPPSMNPVPDAAALTEGLRLLLKQGVHRAGIKGTLTVCMKDDKARRLTFTKQIGEYGGIGFSAAFIHEAWAEQYYEKFRAELDRRGIRYEVVYTSGTRSLVFELGRDFGGAYVVTRILFEDVLEARLNRECVMYLRDTLVRNIPRLTGVPKSEDT
jgi:hypothetical protein